MAKQRDTGSKSPAPPTGAGSDSPPRDVPERKPHEVIVRAKF